LRNRSFLANMNIGTTITTSTMRQQVEAPSKQRLTDKAALALILSLKRSP